MPETAAPSQNSADTVVEKQVERPSSALDELINLIRRYDLWMTLAWSDTKLRYRRTVLGPFWVTITTGVLVLSVGLVYGKIFGSPSGMGAAGYMAYFATGIVLWSFISATLNEGCSVFIQNSGLIKALPVPLLLHVLRMMARNIVLFAHNAVIVVLLWLFIQWPVGWSIALVLPGFLLIVLTLFGAILTLGVLTTRFRDIQQLVATLLQLLFLLTPILWPASSIRGTQAAFLVDFNPLYYLLEVVRGPVLGQAVEPGVWIAAVATTAVSLVVGMGIYGRFRHRVAYWL